MTKTISERIADLKAKEDQLAAKRSKLEAVEKAKAQRLEMRRRMIVGEAVLDALKSNPALAQVLGGVLNGAVTKPADRVAIGDLLAS